jgi:hypothetical protein
MKNKEPSHTTTGSRWHAELAQQSRGLVRAPVGAGPAGLQTAEIPSSADCTPKPGALMPERAADTCTVGRVPHRSLV